MRLGSGQCRSIAGRIGTGGGQRARTRQKLSGLRTSRHPEPQRCGTRIERTQPGLRQRITGNRQHHGEGPRPMELRQWTRSSLGLRPDQSKQSFRVCSHQDQRLFRGPLLQGPNLASMARQRDESRKSVRRHQAGPSCQ